MPVNPLLTSFEEWVVESLNELREELRVAPADEVRYRGIIGTGTPTNPEVLISGYVASEDDSENEVYEDGAYFSLKGPDGEKSWDEPNIAHISTIVRPEESVGRPSVWGDLDADDEGDLQYDDEEDEDEYEDDDVEDDDWEDDDDES